MRVRLIRPSDFARLQQIARHYDFPFPDLSNPLYFAKGVVVNENNNNVVGAGFLKHTAEAILILDYDLSKKEKSEVINTLFIAGQMLSQKAGIENWHVFIKDHPMFQKFLVKRYGFTDTDGVALHLLLEKPNG